MFFFNDTFLLISYLPGEYSDNFPADESQTLGNGILVLHKDTEDSIDGTCDQRRSFKGGVKGHLYLESERDS